MKDPDTVLLGRKGWELACSWVSSLTQSCKECLRRGVRCETCELAGIESVQRGLSEVPDSKMARALAEIRLLPRDASVLRYISERPATVASDLKATGMQGYEISRALHRLAKHGVITLNSGVAYCSKEQEEMAKFILERPL